MTVKCFACGKSIDGKPEWAVTRDGQTVPVGSECHRHVRNQGNLGGYKPPLGGPKLFLIGPDW